MFNKKATLLHWILFGIVGIMGIFLVMRIDLSSQLGVKGAWPVSFVQATQESEKDLLFFDQTAQETVDLVLQEELNNIFSADLGCGMFQNVPLWNNPEGFCPVKLNEKTAEKVKNLLLEKTKIDYEKVLVSNSEVVGIAAEKKKIVTLTENIPTETRSAGLFETYEAYLVKPFYLSYEYNPSFRARLNSEQQQSFVELGQEAEALVLTCRQEAELLVCLEQKKDSDWKFNHCAGDNRDKYLSEGYLSEGRFVVFCVQKSTQQYKFALDFTERGQ